MGKGKALNICLTILLSLAAANAPAFAAKTIYVDDDATGANNGSSWVDAYNYLQDALADAESSPKPVEIRVAQGVYTPDRTAAEPNGTGDREATFQLISGVTLKGGYAGLGQADPNDRDIELYETVLSGDIGEPLDNADNSYHVVTGSGTDTTAVLDGFAVRRGNADNDPTGCGAGMYNEAGSPTVANCTFLLNVADSNGAGMYNSFSSPTITSCRFILNYAKGAGGGGISNDDSSPRLVNCTFFENLVEWGSGGAILSRRSTLALVKCILEANHVSHAGGAMANYDSNLSLTGCAFVGNFHTSEGGHGGGMCNVGTTAVLTDCRFIENEAGTAGGGMYNLESDVTEANCVFEDNWAAWGSGGGMFNELTKIWVSNCTFKNNFAFPLQGGGGGICNDWPGTGNRLGIVTNCIFTGNWVFFGGIANWNRNIEVRNCVFVGNDGGDGALLSDGPVVNCIVWNNTPVGDQIRANNVQFCNVQGGYPGIGNIDADPCFVDIGFWDDNGTSERARDDFYISGDYHLRSQAGRWDPNSGAWVIDDVTSPCIDAGDPLDPIGHEPFPNGGIINMGARGGTAEASKSYFGKLPCETIIAGDINGDCQINFKDFFFIAQHWLTANTP